MGPTAASRSGTEVRPGGPHVHRQAPHRYDRGGHQEVVGAPHRGRREAEMFGVAGDVARPAAEEHRGHGSHLGRGLPLPEGANFDRLVCVSAHGSSPLSQGGDPDFPRDDHNNGEDDLLGADAFRRVVREEDQRCGDPAPW